MRWWESILLWLGFDRVPVTEDCPTCGGSGFFGCGSGYGDVCSDCTHGQVLVRWRWGRP